MLTTFEGMVKAMMGIASINTLPSAAFRNIHQLFDSKASTQHGIGPGFCPLSLLSTSP
jgi:hypothetical protein